MTAAEPPYADGADCCELVVTAGDAGWLEAFARRLVEDRLAACGQLLPAIRSVYRWQGEVQADAEARVALHTRTPLVARIVERCAAEHPYEVPCVIALPIVAGDAAYLAWVRTQTLTP